jgi:hypothetical protein
LANDRCIIADYEGGIMVLEVKLPADFYLPQPEFKACHTTKIHNLVMTCVIWLPRKIYTLMDKILN